MKEGIVTPCKVTLIPRDGYTYCSTSGSWTEEYEKRVLIAELLIPSDTRSTLYQSLNEQVDRNTTVKYYLYSTPDNVIFITQLVTNPRPYL